jgi:hypothetical protein
MPLLATTPPNINGHRYDFSSITVRTSFLGALRLFGVKDINYKQRLTPGKARGTNAAIMGRSRGTYESDGGFTMYREEYQAFIHALSQGGRLPYMEVNFDIQVGYAEVLGPTSQDELLKCRITDEEDSHSEGETPLVTKVTLDIFRINRDGKQAVTDGYIRAV